MSWLHAVNATITAKPAPPFSTPVIHWIALLCLCSQSAGRTDQSHRPSRRKQFGLRPPAPLAIVVVVMQVGALVLLLSGFVRWAGALVLGGATLCATFVANRFRNAPLPKRYATENAFFEHLGLVGGFILVAWYHLQRSSTDLRREPRILRCHDG